MKNYDYTKPGFYYLTLCCQERAYLFGRIEEAQMHLNPAGRMVAEQWALLPQRFPHIRLHDFVVMPNHFHGVMEIIEAENYLPLIMEPFAYDSAGVGAALVAALGNKPEELKEPDMGYIVEERATTRAAPTPHTEDPELLLPSINNVIGAFKSITTVEYIKGVKEQGWPEFNKKVWQRNYWERVIRTQAEYEGIGAYIRTNPARWKRDFFVK